MPDAFAYHQIIINNDGTPVDYIFREVNAAFEEMTGLTRAEVIGKRVTQVHSAIKESALDWIGVYGKVAQGGDAIRFEHYFEPAGRWYEISAYSDEPGSFVTIFCDISMHKNMETDFSSMSGRLKAIIDNSPLLISEFKPGGQYLMENKAVADLLNMEPSEIAGCSFEDFLPPETVNLFNKRINTVVSKKEPIRVDDKVTVEEKSYYYMTTLFPLCDASGRVSSIGSIAHDITDRIETENALRDSEEKHRRLFETMAQGVVYQAADGTIISANPAAEKILGLSLEQMQGKTSLDPGWKSIREDGSAFPGEEHAAMVALRTGNKVGPIIMGVYNPQKNEHVWLSVNATPLFIPGETKPYQVYATFDDITESKQAEEELIKFKTAVEQSADGVAISDLSGNILFINDAWFEMHGYSFDEVKGSHLSIFHNKEQIDNYVTPFNERLMANGSNRGALEHTRKDKTTFPTYMTTTILKGDNGKPFGMLAIARDITEQIRVKKDLTDQKERLANIVEGANVGTWEWKVQTGETIFNNKWAEIIGYTLEELELVSIETWINFTHPDDLEASNRMLEKHLRGDLENYDIECRMLHKEDHWVWINDRGKVRSWADDGKPLWVFGTHIDIAERKQAEEALKLQASERAAFDAFTNSVSHDLQAPLRRVEGFSEALLEECPDELSDLARDYLQRITQQISAMKERTDALLKLSRVVNHVITCEEVNLSAFARAYLEKLRYTEPYRLVETVIEPDMQARGDANLLNIVLENLLHNTWKYSAENKKGRIECGSIIKDGYTVYFVKDNGVGFDQQRADEIFDPFRKLHSETEYQGIGIGLNLVYRIITRHGGKIWAEGEAGKGASFYFTLP